MQRSKRSLVLTVPHPMSDVSPRPVVPSADLRQVKRPKSVSPTKSASTTQKPNTTPFTQSLRPNSALSSSFRGRPQTAQARMTVLSNEKGATTYDPQRSLESKRKPVITKVRYYLRRSIKSDRKTSPIYLVRGISAFKVAAKSQGVQKQAFKLGRVG